MPFFPSLILGSDNLNDNDIKIAGLNEVLKKVFLSKIN
jgi:hypothetical protein